GTRLDLQLHAAAALAVLPRGDLAADFLLFAFFPIEAKRLGVPILGFLLEREAVFVGAVNVVKSHRRLLVGVRPHSWACLVMAPRPGDRPLGLPRGGRPRRTSRRAAPSRRPPRARGAAPTRRRRRTAGRCRRC